MCRIYPSSRMDGFENLDNAIDEQLDLPYFQVGKSFCINTTFQWIHGSLYEMGPYQTVLS